MGSERVTKMCIHLANRLCEATERAWTVTPEVDDAGRDYITVYEWDSRWEYSTYASPEPVVEQIVALYNSRGKYQNEQA